jgi:sphingolipid 4-desaturase/C4-monooxygenase
VAAGALVHRERRAVLLRDYPAVRALARPAPSSFVVIASLVATQLALAGFVASRPWWLLLLVAYGAGSAIAVGLFSMIHEASHGLIFGRRGGNRLAAYLANVPILFPAAEAFLEHHHTHHGGLGAYEGDVAIPRDWEVRWVGSSPWRKAAWLALYPVIYALRVRGMKFGAGRRRARAERAGGRSRRGWYGLNALLQAACVVGLAQAFGARALVYLLLSFLFGFGLHPLNAITLQEHLPARARQGTYSYYGPGNLVSFNSGYHHEHHDLPTVPWCRLPALRRAAPELYASLHARPSWVRLWLRFLTDRGYTLRGQAGPPWHRARRSWRARSRGQAWSPGRVTSRGDEAA